MEANRLAHLIYWLAVIGAVIILLMVALVDVELHAAHQHTITDYLRANPLAYWAPVVAGLVAAVALWCHLHNWP